MQQPSEIERKGILAFLIITFAVPYAIEGALILSGFHFTAIPGAFGQIVVGIAMCSSMSSSHLLHSPFLFVILSILPIGSSIKRRIPCRSCND